MEPGGIESEESYTYEQNCIADELRMSLEELPQRPLASKKIFKVSRGLFEDKVTRKAYEPYIISIGPYHRGRAHLETMEAYKLQFLKMLLERTRNPLLYYAKEMRGMVEQAINCYSDIDNYVVGGDDRNYYFAKMMVLDGCFIVEQIHQVRNLRKNENNLDASGADRKPKEKLDVYVFKGALLSSILHDLALIENQLPFFVLWRLLEMSVEEDDQKFEYIEELLRQFNAKMSGFMFGQFQFHRLYPIKNIGHLADLLQSIWFGSSEATLGRVAFIKKGKDTVKWTFIHSATELSDAGIQFERGNLDEISSVFDIKFENGKFKIPAMIIEASTESFHHNFIAYEEHFMLIVNSTDSGNRTSCTNPYVSSYCRLMDCLINSEKDVQLLRRCGIIYNCLGDDEAVAKMFNRLGARVGLLRDDFFYDSLFYEVNKYYDKKWNQWMATLRRDYFNSPWALISVFGAVFLLLLTVVQTVFAIISRS